ncbi:MAG TPA: HD domain-containing protein [Thermomicrobiales bacterium]|nr:HD domain-containing protein [Thermomicrobiales bacterium]
MAAWPHIRTDEQTRAVTAWWMRLGTQPDGEIRDALYDLVPLTRDDLALIDTTAFQRLDRVQQLGFVSHIWPGAKHTRFEHSLGVMHLARRSAVRLSQRANGGWVRLDDIRTVAAAALLHDIGHYPFSHAIEELGSPVLPHEAVGRRLIEEGELADVLRDACRLDPARVASLIHGERSQLPPRDRILFQILSGTLDVDKLDYLPRDARACHVPYGGVDTDRLIGALDLAMIEAVDQEGEDARVVVTPKGISALHSLINARQEMFDNVYWHHTNRTCMVMLLRAVQDALGHERIAPEELWRLDDASLLNRLQAPEMPNTTRQLATALATRDFHKRALEVSNRAIELYGRLGNLWFDPGARREVECQLAASLSERLEREVSEAAILIDIPKPEKWKSDVWVVYERPPVGMRKQMHWKEVVGVDDADFKRYEEHRRLIRIVTRPELREVVAAEWESLIYPLLGGVF